MVLGDTSGGFTLYAAHPLGLGYDPYQQLFGTTSDWASLAKIPKDRFQVLTPAGTDAQDDLPLVLRHPELTAAAWPDDRPQPPACRTPYARQAVLPGSWFWPSRRGVLTELPPNAAPHSSPRQRALGHRRRGRPRDPPGRRHGAPADARGPADHRGHRRHRAGTTATAQARRQPHRHTVHAAKPGSSATRSAGSSRTTTSPPGSRSGQPRAAPSASPSASNARGDRRAGAGRPVDVVHHRAVPVPRLGLVRGRQLRGIHLPPQRDRPRGLAAAVDRRRLRRRPHHPADRRGADGDVGHRSDQPGRRADAGGGATRPRRGRAPQRRAAQLGLRLRPVPGPRGRRLVDGQLGQRPGPGLLGHLSRWWRHAGGRFLRGAGPGLAAGDRERPHRPRPGLRLPLHAQRRAGRPRDPVGRPHHDGRGAADGRSAAARPRRSTCRRWG